MVMTKSEALRVLELGQGMIKDVVTPIIFRISSAALPCILAKDELLMNDCNLCMSNSAKYVVFH